MSCDWRMSFRIPINTDRSMDFGDIRAYCSSLSFRFCYSSHGTITTYLSMLEYFNVSLPRTAVLWETNYLTSTSPISLPFAVTVTYHMYPRWLMNHSLCDLRFTSTQENYRFRAHRYRVIRRSSNYYSPRPFTYCISDNKFVINIGTHSR